MDANAVEQAHARLKRAERALADLKAAPDYTTAEDAWTDFLLAVAGIYSKLEQGAKGNGKSAAWFGRKKAERKSDPLLRYLHFARNSDEHGIERTTSRAKGNAMGFDNKPLKFGEKVEVLVSHYDPVAKKPIGEQTPGYLPGPGLVMVRAHDRRYGDFCDPPQMHVGTEIIGQFPDVTAELAVAYLSDLVSEAAVLL